MNENSLKNLKRGNNVNCGRKKSGRTRCLELIDDLIAKTENINKLNEDFQLEFDKKPSKFYKEFIEPLIPKEQKLDLLSDAEAGWKISIEKVTNETK